MLDWACLAYLALADTTWEAGNKWTSAPEAEDKAWNDGGVALESAPASGANGGGDGRTCRV